MEYRKLGKTNELISVLGYGASPLGNVFDVVDEQEGKNAVHYAIDHGVNFFDVSPFYGITLAETRLGKALQGKRKDIFLATKCGRYDLREFDFSAKRIMASIDESLQRLQTDYIDLFQLHDIEFVTKEQILNEAMPVIEKIKAEFDVLVSIDTMNSKTARRAVQAGADIVNDISGGLADPQMFASIQDLKCQYILGHWRGHSDQMDSLASYSDVAREVVAELAEQVSMAVASGISRDRIVVDPGLGFAKDIHHNWDLVNRLDELEALGLPVLVGASRKRFLAHALNAIDPASVSMPRRDVATAVLTALLLQRKLWGVRVHEIQGTKDAIAVVAALKAGQEER